MEDFQSHMTVRLLVEKVLTSKWGRYVEIFSAYFSFFACVLYVVSTYFEGGIWWMESIDLAIMIMYVIEYALRLFAS